MSEIFSLSRQPIQQVYPWAGLSLSPSTLRQRLSKRKHQWLVDLSRFHLSTPFAGPRPWRQTALLFPYLSIYCPYVQVLGGVCLSPTTGEEREVGQSWTGGLAQGCAPVFQPFGEPGGGAAGHVVFTVLAT